MSIFDVWVGRWSLTPDGEPIATASSDLLPVRRNGVPGMLKVARVEEERRGAALMAWYAGDGAARVLEREGAALLLERLARDESLVTMSRTGRDDDATRIICHTIARLHARRDKAPPGLVPLATWFLALESTARRIPACATAVAAARELLSAPQDPVVLHGDIHHGNILHDARSGWCAIDPKGLHGERSFDYANTFCNPDIETATAPGCLSHRVDVIASEARIDPRRLLKWVLAYAGLSAAWSLEDRDDPELALTIVQIASRELGITG